MQTLFSFQENLLSYDSDLFPTIENVENFFGLLRGLIDKGKFLAALNGFVWKQWNVFQETGNTKALSECFRCQKIGADYFDPDSFRLKLKAGSSYSNFLIEAKEKSILRMLQPKMDCFYAKIRILPRVHSG